MFYTSIMSVQYTRFSWDFDSDSNHVDHMSAYINFWLHVLKGETESMMMEQLCAAGINKTERKSMENWRTLIVVGLSLIFCSITAFPVDFVVVTC